MKDAFVEKMAERNNGRYDVAVLMVRGDITKGNGFKGMQERMNAMMASAHLSSSPLVHIVSNVGDAARIGKPARDLAVER